MSETYTKPPHGWTCFHCGETFKTPGAAEDHFGSDPSSEPGCRIKAGAERGLLMALRRVEQELAEAQDALHEQRGDAHCALAAQSVRHYEQITAAEELGYERGLRDGRALLPDAARP